MMPCEPGSGTPQMTKATTKPKTDSPEAKKPRHRPPVDVAPLDSLLGFHVRLAMMELRRSFFRHVADGDIRPGLASLLQLVAANPGASQVELSRAMHIDKASLVSLIDRAEQAGWLNRVRSTVDRRRHELQLTASGQRTAEKIRRQTTRHEKKYVNRFSAKELERLVDYLQRIYDD
jgi:DNA-binding MarR family transcriptional regulator